MSKSNNPLSRESIFDQDFRTDLTHGRAVLLKSIDWFIWLSKITLNFYNVDITIE